MKIEPTAEHRWLQRLVGSWRWEASAAAEPGQAPERFGGSEEVRSLDGIWIVGEGESGMPGGGRATTVLTLGFDPRKGRFVGTWIGSMMSNLWVYDGWRDGDVLTLESEGPNFAEDGRPTAMFRDIVTMAGDDRRTLTAQMQNADGSWRELMTARYRRMG
jgi:hypothetical protein